MSVFSTKIALPDPQSVACPKCDAQFTFRRIRDLQIDACGFESYKLQCRQCHAPLIGIIDPADNKLLVSEVSE